MQGAHRHARIGRHASAIVAIGIAVIAVIAPVAPVHAEERVAVLTRMLASSSDKTRLSAVLALAKLGDRAAQKPLVAALRDRNVRVRAVAATALGRLDCDAALPTLRQLANEDDDDDVRKAASNAALKIANASHQRDQRSAIVDSAARRTTTSSRPGPSAGSAAEPHAELYLLINSSTDDSPGTADKRTRKAHAGIVKRVLLERFASEASITSHAVDAERWGLEARHIDLSVTRLVAVRTHTYVEISAELRIAISDDQGKMLSFLSGGAKVQVPSQKFDARYLPSLRREALENAMRGMFGKLLTHLRDQSQS
jgi:hypothetical protein